MKANELVSMMNRPGIPFDQLRVKAICILPDDPKMMIEMEFVQALDGLDGTIVFQLQAKDDAIAPLMETKPYVHP